MHNSPDKLLRVLSLVLGALVLAELVHITLHVDPLSHVTVPAVPSLAEDSPAGDTSAKSSAHAGTNPATNQTSGALSNANSLPVKAHSSTNPSPPKVAASGLHGLDPGKQTNALSAQTESRPGHTSAQPSSPTNTVSPFPGMAAGPPAPFPPGLVLAGQAKAVPLAPEIQARIDRITESEILGPQMHPMPMALLGIAGGDAFLRAPSGQTGMIKPGESLGEIKLLRIGINRVLIEQDGQQKELTIFSGMGGETLISNDTATPHENNHQ